MFYWCNFGVFYLSAVSSLLYVQGTDCEVLVCEFLLWISVGFWSVCSPVHVHTLLCHLSLFCWGEICLGLKKNTKPKASICFNCKENLQMWTEQERHVGKPVAHVARGRCCRVFIPFNQREVESKEMKRHRIAKPRPTCAGQKQKGSLGFSVCVLWTALHLARSHGACGITAVSFCLLLCGRFGIQLIFCHVWLRVGKLFCVHF